MVPKIPDRATARRASYGDPGAPVAIAVETLADGTCLVSVWGEVDLSTAPYLEQVLEDAVRGGENDVVIAFSRDSLIDSTGLGVLVQTAEHLAAAGHSLHVTTESLHMRRVIETMGLVEKVGLVDSPAEGEAGRSA